MILIIGAGLTGLSTAYHLQKLGITDMMLCEKNSTPGGLLRTSRIDGFTFDHTGHFIHINDDYFAQFLATVCNMGTFERINRTSGIYSHGMQTPYPFQMNLFGLPPHVITDCITGFIKRPRMGAPQTFHQWVAKYFGAGLGKHFFFPFQKKILSYDLRKIEPSWTGRFVPKTNLEAMISGAVAPQKPAQKIGYNSNLVYPKKGGIDHLITNLRQHITTPISTDHELVNLDLQAKKATFSNGRTVSYTHLVSTMPLDHLLKNSTGTTRTTLPDQHKHLHCNSVLNINLGIAQPTLGDVHWLYVPDPQLPFYRVGLWHNICRALAPHGHSSLYAELSFMPGRTSKKTIMSRRDHSIAALQTMLGFSARDIVLEHDLLLAHAYVIYDQWRKRNLPRLLARLADFGIHSTGRFGGWKYSSMQEAVLDGRTVAATIAAQRKQPIESSDDHIPVTSSRQILQR